MTLCCWQTQINEITFRQGSNGKQQKTISCKMTEKKQANMCAIGVVKIQQIQEFKYLHRDDRKSVTESEGLCEKQMRPSRV